MWKEIAVDMRIKLGAALAASLYLTLACTAQKGEITSDGSSTVTGSIFATKVYPTSEGENWTAIQQAGTFFVKGTSLSIKGTCTRGVAKIKVGENGTGGPFYSEEATCGNDGFFTWTKDFGTPIDTTKTITLVAFDISDAAITGADDSVSAHVDDTVPPGPTITDPAGTSNVSPYTYNGSSPSYLITGTTAGDAVRVVDANGVNIVPSAGSFSQTVPLTAGQSHTFSYRTYDLAGNVSPAEDVYIDWTPSVGLLLSGVFSSGGIVSDGVTNYSVEQTVFQFTEGEHAPLVSTYVLQTGFNFVTNSARQ